MQSLASIIDNPIPAKCEILDRENSYGHSMARPPAEDIAEYEHCAAGIDDREEKI